MTNKTNKTNQTDRTLQKLNLNEKIKLILNIEGVKKADKGDFDEALECFSKAIELPPKDSVSYFNRASLRMYLGDINGAKSDIKALKSRSLIKILTWGYLITLCFIILISFL